VINVEVGVNNPDVLRIGVLQQHPVQAVQFSARRVLEAQRVRRFRQGDARKSSGIVDRRARKHTVQGCREGSFPVRFGQCRVREGRPLFDGESIPQEFVNRIRQTMAQFSTKPSRSRISFGAIKEVSLNNFASLSIESVISNL
jgi:hypothetical protein